MNRRLFAGLLDCALLFVASTSISSAQSLPTTISAYIDPGGADAPPTIAVHVRDETGGNVASALVIVSDSRGGQPLTRNTDDSGRAVFPGLRTGQHDVLVTKAGFRDGRRGVELKGSARQDVTITLEIAGFADSLTVVGETAVNALNGRG